MRRAVLVVFAVILSIAGLWVIFELRPIEVPPENIPTKPGVQVAGKIVGVQIPPRVEAGEPFVFSVRISNTGNRGGNLAVEARIGKKTLRKSLFLAKGETGELDFELTVEREDEINLALIHGTDLLDTRAVSLNVVYPQEGYPKLTVGASVGGEWIRGADDLPIRRVEVTYGVTNQGTAEARSIGLKGSLNGEEVYSESIPDLAPGESWEDIFDFNLEDGSYSLLIRVESERVESRAERSLEISFPRHFSSELCHLYISPRNPIVRTYLDQILKAKPPYIDDLDAIREWIDDEITYRYDNEVHGKTEYWQFSPETLRLRTGDCEDFSILLCSFFRAHGVPESEIYVALGVDREGNWHAYALWYNRTLQRWEVIEPQVGGFVVSTFASWKTATEYTTKHCFNDAGYAPYDESKFEARFI